MSTEANNPEPTPRSVPLQQAPVEHPSKPEDPATIHRRRFLNGVCLAMGGGAAACVLWAVVGFTVVPPLLEGTDEKWRSVGSITDFPVGSMTLIKLRDATSVPWAGYAEQTAAYLHHKSENEFVCFSVNCTHLGCPVRWVDKAELFMCPCHGGVYYRNGDVAAGPPPEPLPQYQVRMRDGKVEVLASPVPITRGVG